ncbi:MAG: carbamate kinase [Elusimicrobia bacterium]|nr:carbamate kinase [Elusimicrobiota bacterium]
MPLAVVAVGGNALIRDSSLQSVADQYTASVEMMRHITTMIQEGWDVVVTHGNGPQVGFNLRRSELANKHDGLHSVPLDSCVADTQGSIGYMFQQVLKNEFVLRGMDKESVTLVTRVLVDRNDPAFESPTKPIGSFMTEEEALKKQKEEGWTVIEDAGRGWRRVVASPVPEGVLEENAIKTLASQGFVVVAAGGGGIPVYRRKDGIVAGIEAVIDKDYVSALLASRLEADLLVISTGVEKVALNFGKPNETKLDRMTVEEAERYLKEGHFAAGSMGPKIEAILHYLQNGGKRALITSPEKLTDSVSGSGGTEVVA